MKTDTDSNNLESIESYSLRAGPLIFKEGGIEALFWWLQNQISFKIIVFQLIDGESLQNWLFESKPLVIT